LPRSSTQTELALATPDPAAQLVELREAEAIGMPSMIISVALGTSTPTSITVVATSTPISVALEGGHHRILFGPLHPAMDHPDRSPNRARTLSRRALGGARSETSLSSTSGHTQ
jgi:hypothetical protein